MRGLRAACQSVVGAGGHKCVRPRPELPVGTSAELPHLPGAVWWRPRTHLTNGPSVQEAASTMRRPNVRSQPLYGMR